MRALSTLRRFSFGGVVIRRCTAAGRNNWCVVAERRHASFVTIDRQLTRLYITASGVSSVFEFPRAQAILSQVESNGRTRRRSQARVPGWRQRFLARLRPRRKRRDSTLRLKRGLGSLALKQERPRQNQRMRPRLCQRRQTVCTGTMPPMRASRLVWWLAARSDRAAHEWRLRA